MQEHEKIFTSDWAPILNLARTNNATDIHFLPGEEGCQMLMRIDGSLREMANLAPIQYQRLLMAIKATSNLDIAENRIPQDGRIKVKISGEDVDFRLALMPTIFGEKLTLRILKNNMDQLRVENIFWNEEDIKSFQKAVSAPYGLVLFCGSTGSGKTTTAYVALQEIIKMGGRAIHTVEDPVEYSLPGVAQSQTSPQDNLTPTALMRSILRHDPDVVYVSECRDREMMDTMLKTAITGHLVLSSLHVADPVAAVERLLSAGANPSMLASSLHTIVCQTLLRKPCKSCAVADADGMLQAVGCDSCNHTGYRGRVAIYEFLSFNKALKDLVRNQNLEELRNVLQQEGHKTLRDMAKLACQSGHTTEEEVFRF